MSTATPPDRPVSSSARLNVACGKVVPDESAAVLAHLGGVDGGLGATGEAELVQQRRDVVLDGLLGEEHLGADLAVGESVRDQPEDPALLRAEGLVPRVGGRVALAEAFEDDRRGLR